MKKFKDFLYDKNDIFIALLILAVAALLITWRMDAIMEYPKTLISDTEDTSTEIDKDSDEQPAEDDASSDGQDAEDSNDDSSNTDDEQTDASASSTALWENGVLSKAVTVSVSGDSAAEAVQCLVKAGLFDDYAEYQSVCEKAGLDHQKISAGKFDFAKGSSKAAIAKAVNWGK